MMAVKVDQHEMEQYLGTAQSVIELYKIAAQNIIFLQKSDSVTFKVQGGSERDYYLLKIHHPSQSYAAVESEMRWLMDLHKDTDLEVPVPVLNVQNQPVSEVHLGNQNQLVTLQRWVEGEILDREPSDEEVHALGVILAKLHLHASIWREPAGFVRNAYGIEQLEAALATMESLIHKAIIKESEYIIYQDTVRHMKQEIALLPKSPDHWGLIHSDLHESNYVVHEGNVRPIDFSACGYGYYLMDLAETCQHLSLEHRRLLIAAYAEYRSLPEQVDRLLETFILWAVIRGFAFHSDNPEEYEYLSGTVPVIAGSWCTKYLQNTRFLLVN